MGLCSELKCSFDWLFDGYLVEENMWGPRVLIGKRKLDLGL